MTLEEIEAYKKTHGLPQKSYGHFQKASYKPEFCMQDIWVSQGAGSNTYQCSYKSKRDGFCNRHHPETVKKREDESNRKYEEKQAQQPWRQLLNLETALENYLTQLQKEAQTSFERVTIRDIKDILRHRKWPIE